MRNRFALATSSEVWLADHSSLKDLLTSQRLYKSLSLLLADRAGINIPASLLLLAARPDVIASFISEWGYPLMIRVDYRSRPSAKPLGGIPLYQLDTMNRVCERIFAGGCLPLFQNDLDRFKDVYSSGVLLSNENDTAEVEAVGSGFDAGDLRLGKIIPHETISLDLTRGTAERRRVISDEVYARERSVRASLVKKLTSYISFANQSAMLLSDLNNLDLSSYSVDLEIQIPLHYERMPTELLSELLQIARTVKTIVLRDLPQSNIYVASLSYLTGVGWLLWDVYGDWYRR